MKYKLVVFDLDFTLWNAGGTWCDHTFPPFTKHNGYVFDSQNSRIFLYPDSRQILQELYRRKVKLAVASRTHEPHIASELIRLFEIDRFFSYFQIFPGSKVTHLTSLQAQAEVPFAQIIFFDDEHRNIAEVSRLGVKSVMVENGINYSLITKHFLLD